MNKLYSIKGRKVLIVDDIHTNREILEQTLELEGYNIIQAPNGEIALKIAPISQPDLILLDIMMPPGIDGFETCRLLKSNKLTKHIPVIFISAKSDTIDIVEGFKIGGADYIPKPFRPEEVRARIKSHILLKKANEKILKHNQTLEEKVNKRTKQLFKTQLEIIQRLSRVTEYRDKSTGFHTLRMSHFCALLGSACGLYKKDTELLLHASPMHDIGKIAIPDSILLKPGKLTKKEWKIMKTHVTVGAEILSGNNSKLIKMAYDIALTHHEKWDGSGYTQGLKGEEIPLVGRICAICDVFDSLVSVRPYKNAWTVNEAVSEIKRTSGSHFDPNLVKLFLKILPDILKTKAKFSDPE